MGMNNPSDYAYFYNSDGGDRIYDADSMCDWLTPFFTTGVFNGSLFVTANDPANLGVTVGTGFVNIEGKVKHFYTDTPITLSLPHALYDRIDTIVVQRNDSDRDFHIKLVTGEASDNPVPTAPVRSGTIYELVLAEIYVRAGESEITQAEITDMRPYEDVCGWVTATVTEIPFDQFAAQFTTQFGEWFDNLHYILDGDVAGHLQNEIDELSSGGSMFAITTTEPTLLGKEVIVTGEDGKIFHGYFDLTGHCLIKGVTSVGTITIEATDGEKTAQQIVNVMYYSMYAVGLMFWNARVSITTESEPLFGKTIIITNTTTQTVEQTRFDSTGHATYIAHAMGTYVFSVVYASTMTSDEVVITEEGDYTAALSLWTATLEISTSSEELYGNLITIYDSLGAVVGTTSFSAYGVATYKVYKADTYTLESVGTSKTATEEVVVSAETTYPVTLNIVWIFGVEWDGSASSALTRTDDAVDFVDPVPAASMAADGSSPFDGCYPWSDIELVEDADAGWLVKYPKFYYKIEKNGTTLNIRISNKKLSGYYVDPLHRDLGDGKGERDFAYLGATLCKKATFKSEFKAGASSQSSYDDYAVSQEYSAIQMQSNISNLGQGIYMQSYSAVFMLQLLYIVEYANWNSQAKIGNGVQYANNWNGTTSTMKYHTGVNPANNAIRYRYLEHPWSGQEYPMLELFPTYESSSIILRLEKDITKTLPYNSSGTDEIGECHLYNAPSSGNESNFVSEFDVVEIPDFGYVLMPSNNSSRSASPIYTTDCMYKTNGQETITASGQCAYWSSRPNETGIFSLSLRGATSRTSLNCFRLMKLPNNS